MMAEAIFGSVILAWLFGCVALWVRGLKKWAQGRPLIEPEPRTSVPWDGLGVMAAFAVYLVLPGLAALAGRDWLLDKNLDEAPQDPRQLALLLAVSATAILAAGSAAVIMLRQGYRAQLTDFGLTLRHWKKDVRLGALTFIAVAPLVYTLQTLLSFVYDKAHPLIDQAQESNNGLFFAAAAFSAVLVAPLVEEVLFRGVLQGWLERYRTPAPATTPDDGVRPPLHTVWVPRYSAIVVSSLIFALAHITHGLAPVSLFFLALALGYLYQQTHRVLPCIVVHVLLNATSLTLLWIGLQTKLGQ